MDRMQRNNLMPTLVMLLLASLTAGCIAYVVPVDTWEKSSLQEYDFEQYVGIGNDVVIRDIGMPTFVLSSDERGETYFLYERTRFVESEWGHYGLRRYSGGGPEFTGDSGRVTNENGKSCYLLVFNVDNRMVRYDADWIRYSPDGRGENKRTNVPGNPLRTMPDLDCREFYWSEEELKETTNVDFRTFLNSLIEESDANAAFALYETLSDDRKTFKAAWTALCKAANNNLARAQGEVGLWHRTSMWNGAQPESKTQWLRSVVRIRPDDRVAYMWYKLAGSNGDSIATAQREYLVADMSSDEIAQAEQLARDWKPGDCPSATNRLPSPGDT